MHAVLGLLENTGLRSFENSIGHFQFAHAEFLMDLPADACSQIVEGGEAVHENGILCRKSHELLCHLVGLHLLDALGPGFHGLSHGYPYVGVEDFRILSPGFRIGFEGDAAAGLRGDLSALFDEFGIREIGGVCTQGDVHAALGARDHPGVGHVIAAVAEKAQSDAPDPSEMFADSQKVRQHLRGMEFIGQTVPDRDLGILCQILHDLLPEAAVLDAVKHAGQNTRGVRNTFFFADLGSGGIQVGGRHAQVMGGNLESAAGAGAGLLEDQGNIFALAVTVGDPLFLFRLEIGSQVDKAEDLLGCKIKQFQEVSVFEVNHFRRPF